MSQISLQRRASSLFKSVVNNRAHAVVLKRDGGGWKRRLMDREAKKDIVFQYAGKKARRSDRIYVWGCSATGALGNYCFLSNFLYRFIVGLERYQERHPTQYPVPNDIGL